MSILHRGALRLALTAATLCGAVTSASAQTTRVARGSGSYVAQNQALHQFAFDVGVLPGGRVQGTYVGIEPATGASVVVAITSLMMIGDTLAVAGPILATENAPPQFVVGATAFFAVNDNSGSSGAPDDFAGLGLVPPMFGNLSIQQIIALIGPPPPQVFAPLVQGDIEIL